MTPTRVVSASMTAAAARNGVKIFAQMRLCDGVIRNPFNSLMICSVPYRYQLMRLQDPYTCRRRFHDRCSCAQWGQNNAQMRLCGGVLENAFTAS